MPENVMFVPECHVDTALTQSLLSNRLKFINHKHGITQVANALKAQAESGRGPRFVVGMVDRDKKFADVKYLRNFTHEVASRPGPNCRYYICQNPQQPSHFLIVMEPACDTWIFEAAEAAQLNTTDFGLPATLAGFINFVKNEDAENSPQLRELLQSISRIQPTAYRELAEFVASVMDENSRLRQQA